MDVDLIRKLASNEVGRRYLEAAAPDPFDDPLTCLEYDKVGAVEDEELLKIAYGLAEDESDVLGVYESLGGKYKRAFGTPMFQMNQAQSPASMGGSPSGAGAMKPPSPMSAGAGGGPKPPGAGGAGGGMSNPMQSASTPKIPGTSGQGGQ
jgi:hypothetical protein